MMLRNWWMLGKELRKMEKHKGAAQKRDPPGDSVRLSELGINRNQSASRTTVPQGTTSHISSGHVSEIRSVTRRTASESQFIHLAGHDASAGDVTGATIERSRGVTRHGHGRDCGKMLDNGNQSLPLDTTDWEVLAIEAGLGGVSPEAAAIAMDEADKLFNDSDAELHSVQVAARGILALLRCKAAQDTPSGLAPSGVIG